MKKNNAAAVALVSQLCPQCGLCCNGVLFKDVRLQPGDNARRLEGGGLPLRHIRGRTVFPQPCACFDGSRCRIYAERPEQCRAFECGLLKRAAAGELEVSAALEKINQARRQANQVLQWIRRLGDRDEQAALARRYARVMRQPIDLAGPEDEVERRGELMRAMSQLMQKLQLDFLR